MEDIKKIIEEAQQGILDNFGQIYEFYRAKGINIAKQYVKTQEDAEDMYQDAFMKAMEHISSFDTSKEFGPWLDVIIVNTCKNYLVKKRPTNFSDISDDETQFVDVLENKDADIVPESAYDRKELMSIMDDIINDLPQAQKEAVVLYYYKEMSVKQIAEYQEVPEDTIKSRLNYSRKKVSAAVETFEKKNGIKIHSIVIAPILLSLFFKNTANAAYAESVLSAVGAELVGPSKGGSALNSVRETAKGKSAAEQAVKETAKETAKETPNLLTNIIFSKNALKVIVMVAIALMILAVVKPVIPKGPKGGDDSVSQEENEKGSPDGKSDGEIVYVAEETIVYDKNGIVAKVLPWKKGLDTPQNLQLVIENKNNKDVWMDYMVEYNGIMNDGSYPLRIEVKANSTREIQGQIVGNLETFIRAFGGGEIQTITVKMAEGEGKQEYHWVSSKTGDSGEIKGKNLSEGFFCDGDVVETTIKTSMYTDGDCELKEKGPAVATGYGITFYAKTVYLDDYSTNKDEHTALIMLLDYDSIFDIGRISIENLVINGKPVDTLKGQKAIDPFGQKMKAFYCKYLDEDISNIEELKYDIVVDATMDVGKKDLSYKDQKIATVNLTKEKDKLLIAKNAPVEANDAEYRIENTNRIKTYFDKTESGAYDPAKDVFLNDPQMQELLGKTKNLSFADSKGVITDVLKISENSYQLVFDEMSFRMAGTFYNWPEIEDWGDVDFNPDFVLDGDAKILFESIIQKYDAKMVKSKKESSADFGVFYIDAHNVVLSVDGDAFIQLKYPIETTERDHVSMTVREYYNARKEEPLFKKGVEVKIYSMGNRLDDKVSYIEEN